MKRILFFLAVVIFLFPAPDSYGFSEKGQDCSKCHTLSKDEALILLKDLIPNSRILDVKTSPVKSMWEVDVDAGGRKGIVYIDFSKKLLISGAVVDIKSKVNLTQERMTEINKVDVSQIPLDNAIVMGDKNARHKVIVFDDPD